MAVRARRSGLYVDLLAQGCRLKSCHQNDRDECGSWDGLLKSDESCIHRSIHIHVYVALVMLS